ncbi:glycosyl transferase family 2 [Thermodesulfobium narugense DSM 14796]|uniref:Glycosyl transferase family 2 n=1 Tax=Thermodesulfobium narugense DSM 14796 TaxID=747365 RepID=M1E4S4_9BACT|nr:glycosyltransferase family 2 protein [Thermodesulfobium narugense]AEE14482.1 glycosyl transferase family 2 [Thermodesulfobium narugense DSM 14796]
MLSVIIPTYNAEKYLERFFQSLIENLKKCDVKSEIIVIDSSSTDNTVKLAKEFKALVYVIPKKEFDHGGTRSYAAKIAAGDILIFFTQDALLFDELSLSNLISHFQDRDVGAVYGRQICYKNTNPFGRHLRLFNYPEEFLVKEYKDKSKYGIKTAFMSNSFCGYRKTALDKIGYFKESLIMGEDTYAGALLLKAGYKIVYEPKAIVFHSHNYTVFEEFRRYFDIGVFHNSERWLLEEFGSAQGEGKRYIKSELNFLIKNRLYKYLPEYIVRNLLKYTGYKLGINYKILPKFLIKKFSMHKGWWNKKDE